MAARNTSVVSLQLVIGLVVDLTRSLGPNSLASSRRVTGWKCSFTKDKLASTALDKNAPESPSMQVRKTAGVNFELTPFDHVFAQKREIKTHSLINATKCSIEVNKVSSCFGFTPVG